MQQIHGLTLIQGSEDKIKFSNYGRQAGARLCQAKLATKCCKRQAVWAGAELGQNWDCGGKLALVEATKPYIHNVPRP